MTLLAVTFTAVRQYQDGAVVLDGIDLTVAPGITGLLGRNGAGKSTLLRLVATATEPDEGTIRILGRDPAESPEERKEIRRRLGYLPQSMGLFDDMAAVGYLEYMAVLQGWENRRKRRAEARRVLDLVGLTADADRRLDLMSGGQRRRLALAQALLGDPPLLVLDEPIAGLDPEQHAAARATIRAAGQHAVVLLATHETEDVAALCDRVIVLHAGRVRFDGAVSDLVATVAGRVWLTGYPVRDADRSWAVGRGNYRSIADSRPASAVPAEPTVEDAYLRLLGDDAPLPASTA